MLPECEKVFYPDFRAKTSQLCQNIRSASDCPSLAASFLDGSCQQWPVVVDPPRRMWNERLIWENQL